MLLHSSALAHLKLPINFWNWFSLKFYKEKGGVGNGRGVPQCFVTLLLILILLLLTISAADLTADFQGDPDFCPTLSQNGLFARIYPGTFPARTLCCLWWRISDGLIAAVEANYANLNMLSLHSALLMPRLAARDRGCQLSPQAGVACLNLPVERKKKKKKNLWSRFFSEKWIGALQTRGSFVALGSTDLRVVASPWHCV